jgi:hypothetical protein
VAIIVNDMSEVNIDALNIRDNPAAFNRIEQKVVVFILINNFHVFQSTQKPKKKLHFISKNQKQSWLSSQMAAYAALCVKT